MKDFIYDNLGFMSIYLKPQGQEADLIEPLIVKTIRQSGKFVLNSQRLCKEI